MAGGSKTMIQILYLTYPIRGFPNYEITTDGKVWSRLTNKFLKPVWAKNGYYHCSLQKNKKEYYKSIHRLVLETFVGSCPKGMECCHNNGIKNDNRLENLRWDTAKSNSEDSKNHGTRVMGENRHNAKLTERDVRMIIELYKHWYYTQGEIAKMYKVTRRNINHIVNNKTWKHIWRD